VSITECRNFKGDRPCQYGCTQRCHFESPSPSSSPTKRGPNILLVHLGALGAVVRSTSLLEPIAKKHPGCQIFWVTERPEILGDHPGIYQKLNLSFESLMQLTPIQFEAAYIVDKDIRAAGFVDNLSVKKTFGFVSDQNGVVVPATKAADRLWQLGIDNNEKFFVNKKSEAQLLCESLELEYWRSQYSLPLSETEKALSSRRRLEWLSKNNDFKCKITKNEIPWATKRGSLSHYNSRNEAQLPVRLLLGFNTGCSNVIPYKKMTVEGSAQLINLIHQTFTGVRVVLLGGKEDLERNKQILDLSPGAIMSPHDLGLRDGLSSIAACDLVLSGDSLGMHFAISQRKWTIAWFGPTCSHEIDLFDCGYKVIANVPCGPCWKRSCDRPVMCYDHVPEVEILKGIEKGLHYLEKQNFGHPNSLSRRSTPVDSPIERS